MTKNRRLWVSLSLVAAMTTAGSTSASMSQHRLTPTSQNLPGWYTSALHKAVIAAGHEGATLPAEAGITSIAFPGIRPGTWMVSPNWCTLNFVFSSDGTLGGTIYVGTAKHCVRTQTGIGEFDPDDSGLGHTVSAVISTQAGSSPRVVHIGTVVDVSRGMQVGNDFALIRLDENVRHLVSPSMAGIGGPDSLYSARNADPALFFGHGTGIGTGGTARAGNLVTYSARVPSGFGMASLATPGDSGSPVITPQGGAVGVITHIGANVEFPGGTVFGTRLDSLLAPGALTNKTQFKLVTCASPLPWTGLGCPR